MVRGLSYDINTGPVVLTPSANIDLVNRHEVYVIGLVFGIGW